MKFNKDRDTKSWTVFTAVETDEEQADFNKLYVNPEGKYANLDELDLYDKTEVVELLNAFVQFKGIEIPDLSVIDKFMEEHNLI